MEAPERFQMLTIPQEHINRLATGTTLDLALRVDTARKNFKTFSLHKSDKFNDVLQELGSRINTYRYGTKYYI
jgi:hypothetical protein